MTKLSPQHAACDARGASPFAVDSARQWLASADRAVAWGGFCRAGLCIVKIRTIGPTARRAASNVAITSVCARQAAHPATSVLSPLVPRASREQQGHGASLGGNVDATDGSSNIMHEASEPLLAQMAACCCLFTNANLAQ